MNRLESQYFKDVDFIHLDVDKSELNDVRSALRIRGRSEYILYDGDGEEIGRWFGALNQNVGSIVEALKAVSQN